MKLVNAEGQIALYVTREQLVLLANSVNEALEALEEWEFPIRLGMEVAEAERVSDELSRLIGELPE